MNDSGKKALQIMNETGFRAIPVLAEDEKKFMGIIFVTANEAKITTGNKHDKACSHPK